ncbi:MAG: SH3 domain-containing protein [Clostridia bacterium]|nr:SH3 domain-containing protein [Clostridia bacterium]
MPMVYIKPHLPNTNNISDYYLNLITKELTNSLNLNSIKYEITEFDNKNQNDKLKEIFLTFEFNDNRNTNTYASQDISICVPKGEPYSNRLANCIFENISKILNTKIVSLSNNCNYTPYVIINFEISQKSIEKLRNNIEQIPQEIVMGLDKYFGIPFVTCAKNDIAVSTKDINMYMAPNISSRIINSIEPSEKINIIGQWEDWYIVKQHDKLGYIQTKFVNV